MCVLGGEGVHGGERPCEAILGSEHNDRRTSVVGHISVGRPSVVSHCDTFKRDPDLGSCTRTEPRAFWRRGPLPYSVSAPGPMRLPTAPRAAAASSSRRHRRGTAARRTMRIEHQEGDRIPWGGAKRPPEDEHAKPADGGDDFLLGVLMKGCGRVQKQTNVLSLARER